ncbi:hypothetical protein DUNSADRAFT_9314 [Dunaliella salina]|uniref:Uncharacterized protein n=1 Tax=Dunaliella salina TaxID=3046 RepID=A0ABQ7GHN9_DUNSA|nr:hypothetical protein DUNSADRAFT_9314 [Dunaliella salina]|eukprot:KAF5834118.1 hypothetical protein DUNSADRAFT_9314 [Dunaliella salina]
MLIEMSVTAQPIDLRAALATTGKVYEQPLTSDPSTWLEPIFEKPGPSKIQAFTKKVSIDYPNGRIMQQSAACELPLAPEPDHPLLEPWMDGSPTAIHVPAGYHLFTYPDRAYMICAKSLNLVMQQQSSSQGSMVGGAQAPGQGRATDWVMEVGVAGFEGRWCRVRTYLRQGCVQCWCVLEYLP